VIRSVYAGKVLLTLPAHKEAVVVAAAEDFNQRGNDVLGRFKVGSEAQVVTFEVDEAGRVLGSCGDLGQNGKGKRAAGAAKEKKVSKAERAADEELQALGGAITSGDVKVGKRVKGVVMMVSPTHTMLRLGKNIRGYIHALDMPEGAAPFTKGQAVEASVTAVKTPAGGKDDEHAVTVVDMSLSDKARAPVALEKLKLGDVVTGLVQEVKGGFVWVELSTSLKGRVSALDASASLDVIQSLTASFSAGQRVRCRVVALDVPAGRLDLSFRGVGAPDSVTPNKKRRKSAGGAAADDIVPGACVPCKVRCLAPAAHTNLVWTCSLTSCCVAR
jgi:ribosomal protein S1